MSLKWIPLNHVGLGTCLDMQAKMYADAAILLTASADLLMYHSNAAHHRLEIKVGSGMRH
jgi:hypothetical protein